MHNALFKSFSFVRRSHSKGFTLLEVMVALAVIALALAAATSAVSGNIRNASGLQQRTYAHWVAMNKLTEMQLANQWPATKTSRGSSLMAKQEWYWSITITKTPDGFDLIRKVDITVRLNEDDESSLITLTGFVGRP
ncbi:MAG: type II secretion system minor pseudopilin GspI [Gammaproteobacteria bacterium]